jgi:2-keto-4-pentenoate hydratase
MNTAKAIARAFLDARANGRALADFPLALPETLAEAYAIQELEMAEFSNGVTGWKIAMVKPDLRAHYGAERISAPIVRLVDARVAADRAVEIAVVEGGFAAIEAEFAFRMAEDLPIRELPYTPAEFEAAIASLHVAAEVAGSPLASINDLGPAAVVSDHGNNAAIVIGDEIADWQQHRLETLTSRSLVDGAEVGKGSAASLEGGPLGALSFLVGNLAERGHYLKTGDWVSTGATTGVHRIAIGSVGVVDFGPLGTITINILPQPKT